MTQEPRCTKPYHVWEHLGLFPPSGVTDATICAACGVVLETTSDGDDHYLLPGTPAYDARYVGWLTELARAHLEVLNAYDEDYPEDDSETGGGYPDDAVAFGVRLHELSPALRKVVEHEAE